LLAPEIFWKKSLQKEAAAAAQLVEDQTNDPKFTGLN
jgi:hypothetical protein